MPPGMGSSLQGKGCTYRSKFFLVKGDLFEKGDKERESCRVVSAKIYPRSLGKMEYLMIIEGTIFLISY